MKQLRDTKIYKEKQISIAAALHGIIQKLTLDALHQNSECNDIMKQNIDLY